MPRSAALVLALVACDAEPAAEPTCAAWLACYEQCDPLIFVGDGDPRFGPAAVGVCDEQCASETSSSTAERSIVAADLELADVERTDAERVAAAVAGIRARAACHFDAE